MSEENPASPEEIVSFFQRQREDEKKKILDGINPDKFSSRERRRMAGRVRYAIGGKACVKPTAARLYEAKAKLRATARELRSVDPRNIINAVAAHCRMESLTIARLWPEIAREMSDETIR